MLYSRVAAILIFMALTANLNFIPSKFLKSKNFLSFPYQYHLINPVKVFLILGLLAPCLPNK